MVFLTWSKAQVTMWQKQGYAANQPHKELEEGIQQLIPFDACNQI
jgi:hypothetical protein